MIRLSNGSRGGLARLVMTAAALISGAWTVRGDVLAIGDSQDVTIASGVLRGVPLDTTNLSDHPQLLEDRKSVV